MAATADSIDLSGWDGETFAYVAPPELAIDPGLEMHTEAAEDLDPIQYEVLRYNLWNINDEHGVTMIKVSGSPIASFAHDMNCSILTETGDYVYFAPYILWLNGAADSAVKWTLENRSANPGIKDGDVFLTNDPWKSVVHQSDVCVFAPVFVDGKLFAWVANSMHQFDRGGSTPGSFCGDAVDVFHDPPPIPPVKIMENWELRSDVEDFYLRLSRLPHHVALDLRAQIAGVNTARRRIVELAKRYGGATVKGAMRRVADNAEHGFRDKLSRLPDGTWRERGYIEAALPGDRGLYESVLSMTKEGARLIFSNEGSAPQVGSINMTYLGWRASVMTALTVALGYDQNLALGGAQRLVEFRPQHGTIDCADYPAAVSTANIACMHSIALAGNVVAKMLMADPELRRDAYAPSGLSLTCDYAIFGNDQRGDAFIATGLDVMAGATGAFTFRDGIGSGGYEWDPKTIAPNMEHYEYFYPMLYLYRREGQDSGGPGKFRGGNSLEIAFIPHDVDQFDHGTFGSGVVPPGLGLAGGWPGASSNYYMHRDTDVQQWLADGRLPGSVDDLKHTDEVVPLKGGMTQTRDDVFRNNYVAGTGYGDPLERDPAVIERDLRQEDISVRAAREIFGAVVDEATLSVDAGATEQRRRELREARIAGVERPPAVEGEVVVQPHEYLEIVRTDEGLVTRCTRCSCRICEAGENPREHAVREVRPVTDIAPQVQDTSRYVDADVEFRLFHCPGCGGQIDVEVARADHAPLHDVEIDLEAL